MKLGNNEKIEVIANGIDVENIKIKDSWRRNKNILFLSRIHVKKGIEFLLEAASSLKSQLEGYTITIAGEGEPTYVSSLKLKTIELGIEKMVTFCGGVYGEKKWELYRKADVFILPTYSENFGIVVAESLASGTPVITTKGTPWEELNLYKCGWWIEVGSETTKEALIKFLALSEDQLKEMGCNGRKLIETKYSNKAVALEIMNLYTKLTWK